MFYLLDKVPKYLLGKYQMISTVNFTVIFCLAFLLLTAPFSKNVWFNLDAGNVFAFTVFFFVLATTILVISRRALYKRSLVYSFEYYKYILWIVVEGLLISAIYTFLTVEGERYGLIDLKGQAAHMIFLGSSIYIVFSLLVPAIITGLVFALEDRDNTIRMLNVSNVIGDIPSSPEKSKRITLFDNNGVLKFSVTQDNLFYIESDDNYIIAWYLDETGKLKQYMLRCRLKTVEDSFADSDLVRCHRKYLINISKVSVLKAGQSGYQVDLGLEGVEPIPVSKTYEENLLARFNSR